MNASQNSNTGPSSFCSPSGQHVNYLTHWWTSTICTLKVEPYATTAQENFIEFHPLLSKEKSIDKTIIAYALTDDWHRRYYFLQISNWKCTRAKHVLLQVAIQNKYKCAWLNAPENIFTWSMYMSLDIVLSESPLKYRQFNIVKSKSSLHHLIC
jgi:hypothetical protein